jgi:hypothetical protein
MAPPLRRVLRQRMIPAAAWGWRTSSSIDPVCADRRWLGHVRAAGVPRKSAPAASICHHKGSRHQHYRADSDGHWICHRPIRAISDRSHRSGLRRPPGHLRSMTGRKLYPQRPDGVVECGPRAIDLTLDFLDRAGSYRTRAHDRFLLNSTSLSLRNDSCE